MYFFWEIVELTRKLILVGVASLELVRPGSVTQLYMALIASVFFLVLQVTHVSSPPRVFCLPHPRLFSCWKERSPSVHYYCLLLPCAPLTLCAPLATLAQTGAQPYRRKTDNALATLLCISLNLIFVFCSLLKIARLSTAVDAVLSDSMSQEFEIKSSGVSVGMALTILFALVVMFLLTAYDVVAAAPALCLKAAC